VVVPAPKKGKERELTKTH
jgi:PAB1-binding protein PBP1